MALIRIKNLRIKTFIGFNPEELVNKQDVVINLEIVVEVPEEAMQSDEPLGIFDYKVVTKKVIRVVEAGHFKLLEVLTKRILQLVMKEEQVRFVRVKVDKPGALRHTDSVSVEMEASK
jgi:D-erythro-7,8-dihydroneopterin triphosphate epimerase